MLTHRAPLRTVAVLALVGIGCQRAPRPLVAGTDACDYCRMTVADTRFGGEVQSRTGRLQTFDAVECLASFYIDASARGDVRAVWVADHETARLVLADSAVFLRGSRLRSPMGRSLVAFAPGSSPTELVDRHGGTALGWSDVIALMRTERIVPGAESPALHDSASSPADGKRRGSIE